MECSQPWSTLWDAPGHVIDFFGRTYIYDFMIMYMMLCAKFSFIACIGFLYGCEGPQKCFVLFSPFIWYFRFPAQCVAGNNRKTWVDVCIAGLRTVCWKRTLQRSNCENELLTVFLQCLTNRSTGYCLSCLMGFALIGIWLFSCSFHFPVFRLEWFEKETISPTFVW